MITKPGLFLFSGILFHFVSVASLMWSKEHHGVENLFQLFALQDSRLVLLFNHRAFSNIFIEYVFEYKSWFISAYYAIFSSFGKGWTAEILCENIQVPYTLCGSFQRRSHGVVQTANTNHLLEWDRSHINNIQWNYQTAYSAHRRRSRSKIA